MAFLPAVQSQTAPNPDGTPCEATGEVVDVSYNSQYLVCKSNITFGCWPGNGIGCDWFIFQALWKQQADGGWQVVNHSLRDGFWSICNNVGSYKIQLFVFDPQTIMNGQSTSGNYYYSCGLYGGLSYTYPINEIDFKELYFTIQ